MAEKQEQLQMLWPEDMLGWRAPVVLPEGYSLRIYHPGDAEAYLALMHKAGFEDFNHDALRLWLSRVLPDGFFVVEAPEGGSIVATAMANHNPSDLHPFGGELGWVAADPAHTGRGLGMAVCSAALNRHLDAGYRRIYLKTDDFRLPAIKTYLKLGYQPFLFTPDMPARWKRLCRELSWPADESRWVATRPRRGE